MTLKATGAEVPKWGIAGAELDVGVWWVIAMISASIIQNLCLHIHHHLSMRTGMRIKAALTFLVYQKSMKISPQMRNKFGVGMINNLTQQDANAISTVFWFIHYSW